MSRNLKNSKHFILLLLENNLYLNKHIFIHATPSQLKAVAEIFYNVFKLPLTKKKREKFLSCLKILKKYIKSGERGRRTIARKHFEGITNLLVSIKYYIEKILE